MTAGRQSSPSRDDIEAVCRLTPLQEGILFHAIDDKTSANYIVQYTASVEASVDVDRLETAWRQAVSSHAALRTCFVWETTDHPMQIVRRKATVDVRRLDLRQAADADRKQRVEAFLAGDRQTAFNLRKAPLIRVALIQLDQAQSLFVLTYHHIILDGWSLYALLGEVRERYAGGEAGSDGASRPPAAQFPDFIAWQAAQNAGRARGWWKERLAGFRAPTSAALFRPEAGVLDGAEDYGETCLSIDGERTARLRALARKNRLTMGTLLQGVWSIILSRYAGERDVVFGSTVSVRPAEIEKVETMLGLLINTLPVRVDVDPEAEVWQWLREQQQLAAEARVHAYCGLTDVQKCSELPPGTPLFDNIIVIENLPSRDAAAPEAALTYGDEKLASNTNYPLTLVVFPGDVIEVTAQFQTSRFDEKSIARMLGHFECCLLSLLDGAECSLSDLPIITQAEKDDIRRWLAPVPVSSEAGGTIHESFRQQAQRSPDAVAVQCDDAKLTYAELERRSSLLAANLADRGLGDGDLIGVCMDKSVDLLVAILGVLKSGAAYVPLDPAYPESRLAFILEDTRAKAVVVDDNGAGRLPRSAAEAIRVGDVRADGTTAGLKTAPARPAGSDSVAYVIYTSGSTGKPKGVRVTHANVLRLFTATEHWFGFGPADVWTLYHSYAFDFSVWEMWGALLHGGRLVVVPYWVSRSPQAFHELLAREEVTVLNQTPSAFKQLIQVDADARVSETASLRWIIFGGEALELDSLRPWMERHGDEKPQLINMYGITETTVHVTYRRITQQDVEQAAGSVIGVPIPDLQVYVLDQGLQMCPLGVVGEIFVGGAGVASGYLNRPELTAARFIDHLAEAGRPGRFYRSGDLARVLPTGDLEYLGRADDQVKINGFRIELGEIEHHLGCSADVRDCVVTARDDKDHRRLVAYVIPAGGSRIDAQKLREFLQSRVPAHCIPAAFVEMSEFRLTRNGKIDRRALPAPDFGSPETASEFVAPANETERAIAGVWCDVLGVERVSVTDSFFHLGGDSILSIRTISKMRRAGISTTPKQLFEHPTVRALAQVATPAGSSSQARPERSVGAVPLTPIQRWFFSRSFENVNHWNQAFWFELKASLSEEVLRKAIARVCENHGAFRLRFADDPAGTWTQHYGDDARFGIEVLSVPGTSDPERARVIARESERVQKSLDIRNGPLVRFALVPDGKGSDGKGSDGKGGVTNLLIVAHHLIIDGVSWQTLLEDLERECKVHDESGGALPATADFGVWAHGLVRFAESDELRNDAPFWEPADGGSASTERLPVDLQDTDANLERDSDMVVLEFENGTTEALIRALPRAYRAKVNELLLAALLETLSAWTGRSRHTIDLEGHGREWIGAEIDVTRSIGWFTTLFPVQFDIGAAEGTAARVAAVKDQLRKVPRQGLGFGVLRYLADPGGPGPEAKIPTSQIVFNYLGELDQITSDSELFDFSDWPTGNWRDPGSARAHVLEVSAFVQDGRLKLWWLFNRKIHDRETIERVSAGFRKSVLQLMTAAESQPTVRYALSDFPLATLSEPELQRISQRYPSLQDAYGLSPMQSLYLSLMKVRPELGMDQWYVRFEGEFDEDRLRRAWGIVAQRHEILRSSFIYEDVARPHALIHETVDIPWQSLDWRGMEPSEQEEALRRQLERQRSAAFDLHVPPLTRLTLARLDEARWILIWTNHHMQLDGWSWPMVLAEVGRWYRELGVQPDVEPSMAAPYSRFIRWLASNDRNADSTFWKGQLRDFRSPTPLPAAIEPDVAGNGSETGVYEVDAVLSADLTNAIAAGARRLDVTIGNMIFAAWSVVLAAANASDDIVFGAAFSGRPADLDDVEDIVGPFVNDLPVRVRLPGTATVGEFLTAIRDLQFELTQHQHVPLDDIQAVSDVSWRSRLFNSLLVVQNYGTSGLEDAFGEDVRVAGVKGEVRTNYPLTIVVAPGEELRFQFIGDTRRTDEARMTKVAASLERVLAEMATNPDLPLREVLQLVPAELSRPSVDPRLAASLPGERESAEKMTDVERKLLEVWRHDFQIGELGLHDSWADLGIQSALIVRIHARIRETVAPELSIARLFEFPTISKLAAHIASSSGGREQFTGIASRASRARAAARGRRGARTRKALND